MKKIFITVAILLTVTMSAFGQSFEGKIVYKNTYTTKNPKVSSQKWDAMMGTTQEYFIKKGNYKTVANGTLFQWQLYINKENKLYNKMANSEAVLWNDCSSNQDDILKIEVNKKVLKILGYKCDEVILTCKSGVQKYYFSKKNSVDLELFANHKYGNWFDYLSKSKALPLKSIIETAQFTLESIATEVKPMKLDSKVFELPVGIKTAKSPY